MNELIIPARRNGVEGVVGERIFMMPSNSKGRKDNETKHYRWYII